MKVIKIYNQHRRDCDVDMQCEDCGNLETTTSGYDDRNYWDNVVPSFKCEKCGKSTKDLGIENEKFSTKYPEGYQI